MKFSRRNFIKSALVAALGALLPKRKQSNLTIGTGRKSPLVPVMDWSLEVDAETAFVPGRAIWVTEDGNDNNSGLSIDESKKTIAAALAELRTGDVLNVSSHCDGFDSVNRPFLGWSELKDQLDET